jgi:hypothetical protein
LSTSHPQKGCVKAVEEEVTNCVTPAHNVASERLPKANSLLMNKVRNDDVKLTE